MPKGELTKEIRQQIQITKLIKSAAELRAVLQEKDAIIKAQADEINELKAKLEEKESQRKLLSSYLYKKKRAQEDRKPWGKKPGALGYHRPKPKDEELTSEQTFSLNKCPMCRNEVGQPVDTVIKYEEDIDLAPRKITKKYIITRHWCSNCETFVKVQDIPPISRIGLNALGYILYARYRLRLPIERIKESLADLHDFRLSEGEITQKLQEAEQLFGKDYQSIIELVKQAKIVYADETGWRMDGENWWLWAFRSPEGVRYMLEMSRGKGVPAEALGQKKDRVIVSDGYAVYKNLPGDKQQCWVHVEDCQTCFRSALSRFGYAVSRSRPRIDQTNLGPRPAVF